mmetsp:Transcript_31080/g.89113  ORF Transcript_31080/g.89113 Transcript_31080/m.89113 type:complete len:347 (-) Transcript_31080:697-1737(-)
MAFTTLPIFPSACSLKLLHSSMTSGASVLNLTEEPLSSSSSFSSLVRLPLKPTAAQPTRNSSVLTLPLFFMSKSLDQARTGLSKRRSSCPMSFLRLPFSGSCAFLVPAHCCAALCLSEIRPFSTCAILRCFFAAILMSSSANAFEAAFSSRSLSSTAPTPFSSSTSQSRCLLWLKRISLQNRENSSLVTSGFFSDSIPSKALTMLPYRSMHCLCQAVMHSTTEGSTSPRCRRYSSSSSSGGSSSSPSLGKRVFEWPRSKTSASQTSATLPLKWRRSAASWNSPAVISPCASGSRTLRQPATKLPYLCWISSLKACKARARPALARPSRYSSVGSRGPGRCGFSRRQ